MDKYRAKVIFRKFSDGDIIAIFPEEVGTNNPGTCMSYMHIGQHGSCDLIGMTLTNRLARPEEYKDLKAELESEGYDLNILVRIPKDALKIRQAKLKRTRI